MENGDNDGLDTPVLLGKRGSVLWIGSRVFNSRRFLEIFALFISFEVCGLYRAHDRIHRESIVDRYFTLQGHVRCGDRTCLQGDYHGSTVQASGDPRWRFQRPWAQQRIRQEVEVHLGTSFFNSDAQAHVAGLVGLA
jgi:hypothetical protein